MIFAAFLFTCLTPEPEPLLLYPATVDRDCAPWDGPAFTVSIPLEEGAINISIYQPPDLRRSTRFSFPDASPHDGHALLLLPGAVPGNLTGKVSLQPVAQGVPVEGEFELSSDEGRHFNGAFLAEWGDEIVYCG